MVRSDQARPAGHHVVTELLALSQAVLLDSVDEPSSHDALDRACELSQQAYVVDLAWLRTTPWRERLAASFDPPSRRAELSAISNVTVRHHPESTAAAMLLAGWLASRLGWAPAPLGADDDALVGETQAGQQRVAVRLEAAPKLQVRGLEDVALETASGRRLLLGRGPGGLQAHSRDEHGHERQWTIPGASRGEQGVLGEGIRQALLRDPTYVPALTAARAMLPTAAPTRL